MSTDKKDYWKILNAFHGSRLVRKPKPDLKEELKKLGVHNLPENFELTVGSKPPSESDEYSLLSTEIIQIENKNYHIYLAANETKHEGKIYLHYLGENEDH